MKPTQLQRVQRTRKWISIIFFTTLVSFILVLPGGVVPLPFSSLIAFSAHRLFNWVAGALFVGIYFFLWALAKKRHVAIMITLIFVALEILWTVLMMILAEIFFVLFFLYILPYIWILFCLIRGTIAWKKLRSTMENAEPIQTAEPEPLDIDDTRREKIIEIYRREIAGSIPNFQALEEIPAKKLDNARKKYVSPLADDEKVIFLYDNTITGSGKSGFLLTTKCLYTKSEF